MGLHQCIAPLGDGGCSSHGASIDGLATASALLAKSLRSPGSLRASLSAFLEVPGVQAISCQARGSDIRFRGGLARVHCPAYCMKQSDAAISFGAGVHPFSSSVCTAAVADNVMPPEGGEVLLTKVNGLDSYTGVDGGTVISLPATGERGEAFHAYALDNIDMEPALPEEKVLGCEHTFESLNTEFRGASQVVRCPGRCERVGHLEGSGIYTRRSNVCRAALHAGVIGSDGGSVVVTRRVGQDQYFGSRSAGDVSSDAPKSEAAFTVAVPTAAYLSRLRVPEPLAFL